MTSLQTNTDVKDIVNNIEKLSKTCVLNPELGEKVKELATTAINGSIKFSDDVECNPDMNAICTGYLNAKIENNKYAKKFYKQHVDVINKAQVWQISVVKAAEEYFMAPLLEFFFNDFRMFCTVLKEFNTRFSEAKNINSINKHFDTLLFAFKKLEKSYENANELIEQRKKFEGLSNKPSTFKRNIKNAYTFVKFIWQYKYALYFVGILAFNIYDYVWLPYRDGLSTVLRIIGVICFTFSNDKIIMGNLLNFFQSITIKILLTILDYIPMYSTIKKFLPQFMLESLNVVRKAFEYTILYFTLDFTQVITNMICKGILIFGAGYERGDKNMSDIWEVFLGAKNQIIQKTITAKNYIIEIMSASSDSVIRMMGYLFIDIIGGSVSNLWSGIKSSLWNKFTGNTDILSSSGIK